MKHTLIILILALVCLFASLFSSSAAFAQTPKSKPKSKSKPKPKLGTMFYEPVFEEALDYNGIADIPNCRPDARRPKYHICKNSTEIYERALANAKAKNQPLMAVFGFDNCPPCQLLTIQIFNPKRPLEARDIAGFYSKPALADFRAQKRPLKISLVFIHGRSGHGLALADKIGASQIAKDHGWKRVWAPFIVFVNPQTGIMHSESYWEAKEEFCDWGAEFATSLEGIGVIKSGAPYQERKRCPRP